MCFWLIKASRSNCRINSTFLLPIAWMFRASRLLKGRKDSFPPAGQVYALGLSSLGGKLAMPCSRCGGSAPGPSLFLLSLGGRVMSSTIFSSLLHSLTPLSKLNALAMHLFPGGSSSPVRHVSPFPVDSREYRHTTSAPRSLTSQVVCRLVER